MKELEALRGSSERLRPERVIDWLDATFERWRSPGSPYLKRLAREHPVFSDGAVERGVRWGLERWNGDALRDLRARELTGRFVAPRVTAVWLAGPIPTSSFAALALPLLAGSAVYVRRASADPLSAARFAESLAELDSDLASCLCLEGNPEALSQADAVMASGSDESVRAVRDRVPPGVPFVGYAHKLSLAAIGPRADPADAAQRLALDAALWDGRGCLSPAWALVCGAELARAVAGQLASEIQKLETELPRGPLSTAEHAAMHDLRGRAAVRHGVELFDAGGAADVALDTTGRCPPPGTLRFCWVVQVEDGGALERFCREQWPHLSTIGHAGWEEAALERLASHSGASRLCPLGTMQLPPIDWRHDGMDPIRPLLRWVDVELG